MLFRGGSIAVRWMGGWILLGCLLGAGAGAGYGCTVFSAMGEGRVFFGNNEDWKRSDPVAVVVPGNGEGLGYVVFGWKGFYPAYPQGGMNEAGFAVDGASTPPQPVILRNDRPPPAAPLIEDLLRHCATVDDAISRISHHDGGAFAGEHFLVADRRGDSAIFEWDERDVAVVRRTKPFQIITNFNTTHPERGWFPCGRYAVAERLLTEARGRFSQEVVRGVLEATRQEGTYPTAYSNGYDLTNCRVRVFLGGRFDRSVDIDLREALSRGAGVLELQDAVTPATGTGQ